MKNKIRDNKRVVITLIVSIMTLLLIIGCSYAAFYYDFLGEEGKLEIADVEIEYLESDTNIIDIDNAVPMNDFDGIEQTDTFDFMVRTKTVRNINIKYELVIEKINTLCSDIDSSNVDEYPNCYKFTITDDEKSSLISYLENTYSIDNGLAVSLYEAIINHDRKIISEVLSNTSLTNTEINNLINEMKNNGYEDWLIEKEGSSIVPEYDFVESNYVYKQLNDNEVKIYLTDFDGNVLVEPIKVSELDDYILYSKVNSHNIDTEEIKDKYKVKVWVDEDVDFSYFDDENSLDYKFKIGVRTSPNYNVSVIVQNGMVDGFTNKVVSSKEDISFDLVPNESELIGVVECNNEQIGVVRNNVLTIKKVTNDAVCTVRYVSASTVLYADGTLIINENSLDREANILKHGEVTNEYEAMSDTQSYVFKNNADLWLDEVNDILAVEIGTRISPVSTAYWFEDCIYMQQGNFENIDMSDVTNMKSMFTSAGYNATSFNLIGLDDWDTSNVVNMSRVFENSGYNATEWSIGDLSSWDTSNVSNIDFLFFYTCYKAEKFDVGNIGNWDVSNVTSMASVFRGAGYSATEWSVGNLSNWDTSNVTDMLDMFLYAGYNASKWNVGDLSNWNTSNVKIMAEMFSHAGSNATDWFIGDLSNWDTSNVTSMSSMFYMAGYKANIFNLNLTKWDVSNVKSMSSMFSNAGYKATDWSIGNLSNWNTLSLTSVSSMFYDAGYNAVTFNIGNLSNWNISNVDNMYWMFSSAGKNSEKWYIGDLSNWTVQNVTNMNSVFWNAGSSAQKFNIGNLANWNTSQVTDMSSMFDGAGRNALEWYIGDLSNWDVSSVEDMSDMFAGAGRNANKFYIGKLSKWNVSSVTDMSYMFNYSGEMSSSFDIGDLSSWDTSQVTDMSSMFVNAGYNAKIFSIGNISNWNTSQVTNMYSMFKNSGYNADWSLDCSKWNVALVTNYNYFNNGVETKVVAPTWVN